jgi:hypothetical protein
VRSYRIYAQLLVLILISFSGQVLAQSTIFNIPTTDTVSKGKAYAEFDFMPQAPGTDVSRTYMFNPRLVVGAPHNFELGVNFPIYHTRTSGASATNGYIQPNAKWKFYDNDKAGVALAAGGLFNTPINNRNDQDSWGLLYGLFSKKIKTGDYGPRFHAGVMAASSAFGSHTGVLLGYEQPVQKKVSIVADWCSGNNGLGYFTPGVSITVPGSGLLNLGYSIGNDSWKNSNAAKNRFFFVYYGVTF